MPITETTEKRFESDIEAAFCSPAGGWTKGTDEYDPEFGIWPRTLIDFVQRTQPREWKRFVMSNAVNTERKFCQAFAAACEMSGVLSVLRHGFKHRGITLRVCFFKPESDLNQTAAALYAANNFGCYRQWYYSAACKNSVDMVLTLNGIPLFAFELKNQYTGQTIENAQRQWMYDRDPREVCFAFNRRVLAFFCVDHTDVCMSTRLNGTKTFFLPFNQGSNGAGNDGGKGNPPNKNGYPTAYLWEQVFQRDSMMDIVQKFIHLQKTKEKKLLPDGTDKVVEKKTLIFPRYHQLDVVRKLIMDTREHGAGQRYLIQHSAGSGKSNSIAWTAYRLASLHDSESKPVFSSVIVVTDRTVLDAQLQETIAGFEHTLGAVATIGEGKTSRDLLNAIEDGSRIIVTTLQKFPVIYQDVESTKGRNFAVIVDEAHSSQTGTAAGKLKMALADTEDALKEYAEIEGKSEEEVERERDKLLNDLIAHGRHKNLSFYAFTATPKDTTLELFGSEQPDGSFRPFHIYSMRQAIEEGFILDVLANYMTYDTCYKIAKTITDNPDLPSSQAAKVISRFTALHPYNISQKAQIIVETFRDTTRKAIGGRGKMMVVTSPRLAAVRYLHAVNEYIRQKSYKDINVLVAFSGAVQDKEIEYTESGLNVRIDGSHISENQTKAEFHDNFGVLIVAEKYQTGFDEPLLHTMIVDKKLRGVKAVQTLSRLNRICPGKTDTFILDFMNTADDIKAAFQPYYQESTLTGEINTDLLYQVQKDLRDYSVYTDSDIQAFSDVYFKDSRQDSKAMGRMTSVLKPVADRYNKLSDDDRYQFRRQSRSLVKWYGYITQIARTFDADLHKEYMFIRYLLGLLPDELKKPIDLEGKLELEYYKLKETFQGAIELDKKPESFEPASNTKQGTQEVDEKLDEIIARFNERYRGKLTEADLVNFRSVSYLVRNKLAQDEKLKRNAQACDELIFKDSIFHKAFDKAMRECYMEQQQMCQRIFEDMDLYKAYEEAMCDSYYRGEKAQI